MKTKVIGKRRILPKAQQAAGQLKAARIAKTGLTSRIRGHVSARGRRRQVARSIRKRAVR